MRALLVCVLVLVCMDARAQVSPGGAVTGSAARPTFQGATIKNAAPTLEWYETDAAANNRRWQALANAEQYKLGVVTDAGTLAPWLTVDRTANTIDSIALAGTALTFNGSAVQTAATAISLAGNNTWTGTNNFNGYTNIGSNGPILHINAQNTAGMVWYSSLATSGLQKWYMYGKDDSFCLQTFNDTETGGESVFCGTKAGYLSTGFNVLADTFTYKSNPVAVYADATANFTGALQKSGSAVLTAATTGLARYADATANFTGTLQQAGSNVCTEATCVTAASAVKMASGKVASNGTLSDGINVTSIDHSATGTYGIMLPFLFSSIANCTATLQVSNEDGNIYMDVSSTTNMVVSIHKHDDSYVNQAFNFICVGT